MKKKLTPSFLLRKRKRLKPNQTAAVKFFNYLKKELTKQLNLKKDSTIEDALDKLLKVDFTGIKKHINRLGLDVLKKNREGFANILESLTIGLAQQNIQKQKQREEELFKQALPSLIKETKIYQPFLDKFNENMSLIKNLPTDVERELKKAYLKGEGFRGQDIEDYITEKMGKRAKLIIRTESAKLNSALTEVRAKSLDINCYMWSTSQDARVRPSHKLMNNVLVFFNDTPILDGMKGNAGETPNCRCIELPVFGIDDISFPVKVAERLVVDSRYNKSTKRSNAIIKSGKIAIYNKKEFIEKYGNNFN